jgi:hypothetical protein
LYGILDVAVEGIQELKPVFVLHNSLADQDYLCFAADCHADDPAIELFPGTPERYRSDFEFFLLVLRLFAKNRTRKGKDKAILIVQVNADQQSKRDFLHVQTIGASCHE